MSSGQRQLLLVAKMLLQQPAILLMDDALSILDPASRAKVHNLLHTTLQATTVMYATLHADTLLDFDSVIVMQHGEVIEQGPVPELCQLKGGHFAKMLAAQAAHKSSPMPASSIALDVAHDEEIWQEIVS